MQIIVENKRKSRNGLMMMQHSRLLHIHVTEVPWTQVWGFMVDRIMCPTCLMSSHTLQPPDGPHGLLHGDGDDGLCSLPRRCPQTVTERSCWSGKGKCRWGLRMLGPQDTLWDSLDRSLTMVGLQKATLWASSSPLHQRADSGPHPNALRNGMEATVKSCWEDSVLTGNCCVW